MLDLGLARLRSAPEGHDLTSPYTPMGTPDYLAPEQIDNPAAVDIRADLYSLGATLFFLLTGQPPFGHHEDLLAKLRAHGFEAPRDVRALRPDVPAGAAAVVARLLAKRPEGRYATPQEVADALAPFTVPTAAASPRPRRRKYLLAVALLLLPLALVAALALPKRATPPATGPAGPRDVPAAQGPPAVAQPLKVVRLDVDHFPKEGPGGGASWAGSRSPPSATIR